MKYKKRISITGALVVSYISIFVLPFIVNITSVVLIDKVIDGYFNKNILLSTKNVAQKMDHSMILNGDLIKHIADDDKILFLMNEVSYEGNHIGAARELKSELIRLILNYEYTNDIAFIPNNKNIVVTGESFCTFSQYYSSYMGDFFLTQEIFEEFIDGNKSKGFALSSNDEKSTLIFCYEIDYNKPESPGKIVMTFNFRDFVKKNMILTDNFILCNESEIIAALGNNTDGYDNFFDAARNSGTVNTIVNGCMVTFIKSDLFGYEYYNILDEYSVVASRDTYKKTLFLSLLLIFMLGVGLVILFIRYNSYHVLKILKYSGLKREKRDYRFTYDDIENQIQSISDNHIKLENINIQQKSIIERSKMLNWLLYGEIPDNSLEMIPMDGENYCFLIVEAPKGGISRKTEQFFNIEHLKCFFKNYIYIRTIEIKGDIGIILTFKETDNYKALIRETFEELNKKMECNYKYYCSDKHCFISELHSAYREVIAVISFREELKPDEVRFYEDLYDNRQYVYTYPVEVEKRIINCMLMGQADAVEKDISELYYLNLIKKKLNEHMTRFFFFDVCATIVKAVGQINEEKNREEVYRIIEESKCVEKIVSDISITQKKEILCELVRDVCTHLQSNLRETKSELYNIAKQIIDKRFAEPQLTSEEIAVDIGVSREYLLRNFRENCRMGLIDYLHEVRIKEAQEILKRDSGLALTEISQLVGYSSVKTFSRVFKNTVGVTPGRYREQHIHVGE